MRTLAKHVRCLPLKLHSKLLFLVSAAVSLTCYRGVIPREGGKSAVVPRHALRWEDATPILLNGCADLSIRRPASACACARDGQDAEV